MVVTGGGTGGHVYPGLAVAEVLRRNYDVEILWIGSAHGLEARLVRESGIAFASVPAGKLRRYFSTRNLLDVFSVVAGFFRAIALLGSYRPDFVFSKGGYVSVPPVVAAWFLGVPVATHESDLVPGLATRLNAPFCTTVFLPYDQTARRFTTAPGRLFGAVIKVLAVFRRRRRRGAQPLHRRNTGGLRTRVVVSGNPVRLDLAEGDAEAGRRLAGADPAAPVVLVLGGSQGAEQINTAVADIIEELCRAAVIVHQHGRGKASHGGRVKLLSAGEGKLFSAGEGKLLSAAPRERSGTTGALNPTFARRYRPMEYIGAEYPDLLAAADLVISRAGAGTLWEIASAGKASILVPLVSGSRGDQVGNAELFARAGASVVLNGERVDSASLLDRARRLLADEELRRRMGAAAAGFTHGNAAFTIADHIAKSLEDPCPLG